MPVSRFPFLLAIGLAAGLSACSDPAADSESSDDFAARVNGAPVASQQAGQPQPATPLATAEGKVAGAPTPGATGLLLPAESQSCNAPAAREFLNRADSPELRSALAAAVAPVDEIRFLPPGSSGRIGSRKDRLNVMIDVTGTIRDLRCG